MEHFASGNSSPPANPTLGQVWYTVDADGDTYPELRVYTLDGWLDLSFYTYGASVPGGTHYPGDLWYDTANFFLKVYTNAGNWVAVCDQCNPPTPTPTPGPTPTPTPPISGGGPDDIEYVSPGSYAYIVPAGVTTLYYRIAGGGGGGGGGGYTAPGNYNYQAYSAGGGGGGAGASTGTFSVTPGETITVIVGNGGTGGVRASTPDLSGSNGLAGSPSQFKRSLTVLVEGLGGLPGLGGWGGADAVAPTQAAGMGGAAGGAGGGLGGRGGIYSAGPSGSGPSLRINTAGAGTSGGSAAGAFLDLTNLCVPAGGGGGSLYGTGGSDANRTSTGVAGTRGGGGAGGVGFLNGGTSQNGGNGGDGYARLSVNPLPGSMTWTVPGNYTWTVPVGVTSVTIDIVGGGGGGAGSDDWGSGGGGSGGYYQSYTYATTPGQNISVTVGAGGLASNSGAVGGASIFGTLTANGGAAPTSFVYTNYGLGGAPSGQNGEPGNQSNFVVGHGGDGGGTPWGTGGAGGVGGGPGSSGPNGNAGTGYGSGGGGGCNNAVGGNGAPGRVSVSWN